MAFFTIIAEFKGGTYIEQVRARSAKRAMLLWPLRIDWVTERERKVLINSLADECPTRIESRENVWCFCASFARSFLLCNIVKTSEDSTKN